MTNDPVAPHHRLNAGRVGWMFAEHIRRMPRWHLGVMMLAIAGMVVGTVGVVRRAVVPSQASQQNAIAPGRSNAVTSPHSGFVGDTVDGSTNEASGGTKQVTPVPTDDTPWYLSPRFLRIGGSTVGGFVIGWLMRTFVKTVSLLLAAIAALIGTASYFRIFNVDFSAAHQEFQTASAWLMNQMTLLKTVAIAHLPSHTGAALGAYMGFRRR